MIFPCNRAYEKYNSSAISLRPAHKLLPDLFLHRNCYSYHLSSWRSPSIMSEETNQICNLLGSEEDFFLRVWNLSVIYTLVKDARLPPEKSLKSFFFLLGRAVTCKQSWIIRRKNRDVYCFPIGNWGKGTYSLYILLKPEWGWHSLWQMVSHMHTYPSSSPNSS